MYCGSLDHGRIIEAFRRCVPGSYVRDYRAGGGFLTICRDYRDIKWKDQTTTAKVERQVPATTLASIPRGDVTSATIYRGLALERPGWRREFRRAAENQSKDQMKAITKFLGAGEVFAGI